MDGAAQLRSARADLLDDVVVSVDAELFVDDEDVSLLIVLLLPVPLAPMLEVPVPLDEEELLGVEVLLELLGVLELLLLLYELLGDVLDVLWSVLLAVDEAVVPPVLEPEPLVCATAMPPMASAAAAANVVSVFLVVVMSSAP